MNKSLKIFAAIDVGSYETQMKIFEISAAKQVKEIDHLNHKLDLGSQTYSTGKLSAGKVDELCRILNEFSEIMKSYGAEDYQAYGTSAIREMKNKAIVLEQIKMRTGIRIDVLSNSEQRFLDYKSVAFKGEKFNALISSTTAIIDVGGGSVQVSLFDKDSLIVTQNLRIGILRLRDVLSKLNSKSTEYEEIISDLVMAQLHFMEKLYLKGKKIENIIVIDEYISCALAKQKREWLEAYIKAEDFQNFIDEVRNNHISIIGKKYQMDDDSALLLYISTIMVERFKSLIGCERLWVPDVSLCDGIAYEYGEKKKIFAASHNFEKDIIDSTLNISKRYMGSKKRGETLENIALTIFDSMKKVHGLGNRERLLLRLAALLHDCGKYISLYDVGEASFQIVLQTEIIGLSHREREIVAYVVRYNYREFEYFESKAYESLTKKDYLTAAKLTAMLMISTGLDRSHKEKFKKLKARLKDKELIITSEVTDNISLEKGMISSRARFFREIFDITPVIRQKGV